MKKNPRKIVNFLLNFIRLDLSKVSQIDLHKTYLELTGIALVTPYSYEVQVRNLMVADIRGKVETIQRALRGLLEKILDPSLHTKNVWSILDPDEPEALVDKINLEIMFVCRNERMSAEYSYENIETKLLLDFVNALEYFPLSSIHKCERCKAYFLRGTRREKKFCSSTCYYAYAQAKRRERLETKGG